MLRDKKGRFTMSSDSAKKPSNNNVSSVDRNVFSDGTPIPNLRRYRRDGTFYAAPLNHTEPPKPAEVSAPSPERKFLSNYVVYTPRTSIAGYPACCGAQVWSGFSSIPKGRDFLVKEAESAIARSISYRAGILSCIVTKQQFINNPEIHEVLVEKGFECVSSSGNPNHNNETHLFLYHKPLGGYAKRTSNEEVAQLIAEWTKAAAVENELKRQAIVRDF